MSEIVLTRRSLVKGGALVAGVGALDAARRTAFIIGETNHINNQGKFSSVTDILQAPINIARSTQRISELQSGYHIDRKLIVGGLLGAAAGVIFGK